MPIATLRLLGFASVLFSGAIFGFFYAWVCSTMWGLDAADPRIAVEAMQAMNASVRNAVFAPAFFATPFVLAVTAALAWRQARRRAAGLFLAGALTYLFGGSILTMVVNVPMNEALAQVALPLGRDQAAEVWAGYSDRWQFWNQIRTLASGLTLLLASGGLWALASSAAQPHTRSG